MFLIFIAFPSLIVAYLSYKFLKEIRTGKIAPWIRPVWAVLLKQKSVSKAKNPGLFAAAIIYNAVLAVVFLAAFYAQYFRNLSSASPDFVIGMGDVRFSILFFVVCVLVYFVFRQLGIIKK